MTTPQNITLDLAALEAALAAATPGYWDTEEFDDGWGVYSHAGDQSDFKPVIGYDAILTDPASEADAELIKLARNSLPGLIARVRELERKNLQLANSRLDAANLADNQGMALANVERLAVNIEAAPSPVPGYSARMAKLIRSAATVPVPS